MKINENEIRTAQSTQPPESYSGRWQVGKYLAYASENEIGMSGILQTVRVNWPQRDYYTRKPASWPADASIQGVLRGPESGGRQAQFQIQSAAGRVFLEFHAETDALNPDYFAAFFDKTVITSDSYAFPDDGEGRR